MRLQTVKLTIPHRNKDGTRRVAVEVLPEKQEKPIPQVLVKVLSRLYEERRNTS